MMIRQKLMDHRIVGLHVREFRRRAPAPRIQKPARRRLQHQHPIASLAHARQVRHAREMIRVQTIVRPPRRHIRKTLRVIALARAPDGREREVLVHEVHPVDHQPVAEPLVVLERRVPTGDAVGFAERTPPQLMAHARHLADREQQVRILPFLAQVRPFEHVDARHMLIRVQTRVRRTDPWIRPLVLHPVPGELQVIAVAPLEHRPHEILLPQIVQRLPVIEADLAEVADIPEQRRDHVRQIVTVALLELGERVVAQR